MKLMKRFEKKEWSGGSTTEFFIYPPEAKYEERDFLFRLSTATVEEPVSTFTRLEGTQRILMVLEGQLNISYNEEAPIQLKPNDMTIFQGDWNTTSVGCAVDLNLMMKSGTTGSMEAIYLLEGDRENYAIYLENPMKCFLIFYVYEGTVKIQNGYKQFEVKAGELVVIESEENTDVLGTMIENKSEERAKIIKTTVYIK